MRADNGVAQQVEKVPRAKLGWPPRFDNGAISLGKHVRALDRNAGLWLELEDDLVLADGHLNQLGAD